MNGRSHFPVAASLPVSPTTLTLLSRTVKSLESRATLVLAEDADHSFHVPAKAGRKDSEVLAQLLDAAASWMFSV